ncbi:hypothetical protein OPQ81_007153 [Rhizoctonia solani]|nr:hypothetical protein OPQ81_007153 [Rhizoctonia solani]
MSIASTLEPPPGVSYADFASTFSDNDIRGNVILDLDQHALKEMEITSVGDRIKILNAIKSLRQQCSKGAGPTPRVLLNGGSTSRATSHYELTNGVQRSSSFRHTANGSEGNRDDSITAARRSSGGRRLDGGRPPPLNITQSATRDLPQLSANIATSPGLSVGATTPRPTTQFQSYGQGSQGPGARDQGRTLIDSPSTTPISTVSASKYTPPTRSYGASLPAGQDRRTPTLSDGFTPSSQAFPPPPFTNDPLPPAPSTSGQGSSNGSPPNGMNGGQWQGEYGLPRGPKAANLAVNAHETPGEVVARRAGSPLPPAPVRSTSAKTPIPTVDRTQAGHAKSGSVGLIGQGGTSGKGPAVQPSGRPSTSGSISQPSLHPYVTAAPISTSNGAPAVPFPTISNNNNLRVDSGVRGRDLSPISESHSILEITPTGPSFVTGSGPNTAGSTNTTFSAKRSPFPPKNQAANDLLRSLIKIHLYDSGQPTTAVNSSVVNVSSCHSGVEIIERALKKFNKQNPGKNSLDSDDDRTDETENGGLIVDGWGLFPGGPQNEPTGGPLSEAEILSICHADPKHPTREQGLTLRNVRRGQQQKLANFFGETPPGTQMSPTSPTYPIAPKIHTSQDEEGSQLTPSSLKFPTTGTPVTSSRRMDRASTISIMSGLGVEPPPSPGGTPAGRSPSNNSFLSGGHKKLRNFFGQRPPSELITSHLPEFFPSTSKKVLQRTARNSMLRAGSKRDSHLSVMGPGAGRMSFQAPPKSRFSTSSGGSYNHRKSSSPPRSSMSSGPSIKDNVSTIAIKEDKDNLPPRMSISTDDGRSIDASTDDGTTTDDTESTKKSLDHTLPPLPILGDSLSDSLTTGLSATWLARAESNAAKRMSMMSVRGRDKSDTASLLTVDEITAEVESRRQSRYSMYEDDEEDEDGNVVVGRPNNKRVSIMSSRQGDGDEDEDEGEEDEEYDEEDDEDYDEEDEDEEEEEDDEEEGDEQEGDTEDTANTGRAVTSSGGKRSIKWIKGALIGSGSFGSVYLGMDAVHGLLMAVKQVELPTGSSQNEERKKSMLTALEREIELLKQLQHENIVQYLDSSIDTHHLNIFLEYVPGGSVATLLRNYGAFEETLARNWVRQILQGLNYLHEREIIHRDIKGGNILVDNKGGIKISDFGISKKVEDNLLGGSRIHRPSLQGSVFWMAPEVVKQTSYTYKADIWSVGCLVVEMLTGQHPWAQLSQMQAIFKIGSLARPTIPPDISPEAEDFLNKTFELDYTIRPSAAELLNHPWVRASDAPETTTDAPVDPSPAITVTSS